MKRIFLSFSLLVLSILPAYAAPAVYVDSAGDFTPSNPTNGTAVTWKSGSADAVSGLTFGTDAFTSVQAAINAVNANGTVFIAADTYKEGATLTISKNLTLQGDGSAATLLSGNSNGNNGPDAGEYRVLDITSGSAEVIIRDVSIVDGQGVVTGGSSATNNQGGGINNAGILFIENCLIARNTVTLGGGIYNTGTLTVNLTEISDNQGNGGGIANSGGTLTINDSIIRDNFNFNSGGGLAVTSATINRSTIAFNQANQGGGIAISSLSGTGSLTLNSSTVSDNDADLNPGSLGGGIYASEGSSVTLIGSTISRNTSNKDGGGLYGQNSNTGFTITNSTISQNVASNHGGGAYSRGSLTATGSSFSGNRASVFGGALFNADDLFYGTDNGGVMNITDCVLSGNSTFRLGGAIYNQGGAVNMPTDITPEAADPGARLTIRSSRLSGNSATNGGGAIFNVGTTDVAGSLFNGNSSSDDGGAIYNYAAEFSYNDGSGFLMPSELSLTNSTLSGNFLSGFGGGRIGGGLYNAGSNASIVYATITGNSAVGGGGIGADDALSASQITLQNSLVMGNTITSTSATDAPAGITDAGNNLIGIPAGSTLGDVIAPLADNGGSSQTHALVLNSPAIDAAATVSGVDIDQRGVGRPISTAPDIGAFEFSSAAFPTIVSTTPSGTGGFGAGDEIEIVTSEVLDLADGDSEPDIQLRAISDGTLIPSSASVDGTTITITVDSIDGLPPRSGFNFVFASDAFYGTTSGLPMLASELNDGRVYYSQTDVAYVDDLAGDYTITTDRGASGLDVGDTVTWNGTSQGGPVTGLIFGTDAFLSVTDGVNAVVSGSTLYIAAGTYKEGNTVFIRDKSLVLKGDGMGVTYLSGNNTHRIISISRAFETAQPFVEMSHLSIVDGYATLDASGIHNVSVDLTLDHVSFSGNETVAGSFNSGSRGAALSSSSGRLIINHSTFSGNSAFGSGAAIHAGSATVSNTTISGNSATNTGGGIFVATGTLVLNNCTFSGNISGNRGGAIFNNSNGVVLNHCTVVGNSSANTGGGILNGRSVSKQGILVVNNTLIAGNTTGTTGPDIEGTYISEGGNFIGDTSGANRSATSTGSELTFDGTATTLADIIDPILADNGGPTLTHAIILGSVLSDAGDNASIPAELTSDQRGFPRAIGASVDIGAFEFLPALLPAETTANYTVDLTSKISIADLLASTTGGGGLPLSLVSLGATQNDGSSVRISGGFIIYTPAPGQNSTDRFSYTLTDGYQTTEGEVQLTLDERGDAVTVNIVSIVIDSDLDRAVIRAAGIPGRSYRLESSTGTLDAWELMGDPLVVPEGGILEFADPGPLPPSRFYRVVEVNTDR